jgi:GNAT superfamily N-acetyltransferase
MKEVASIRSREVTDLDALAALAARVHALDGYPVNLPDGDFRRFLTNPNPIAAWVAEEEGRIAGHVAVNVRSHQGVMAVLRAAGIDADMGVIARLMVDPAAQRRGLGRALLDRAKRHVAALGWTPVRDVVAASGPAVSLYQEAGWQEIGNVSFDIPGHSITELVFRART